MNQHTPLPSIAKVLQRIGKTVVGATFAVGMLICWNAAHAEVQFNHVAKARFSYLFWDIYDATWYGVEPLAQNWQTESLLELQYLRDIDKADFIARTAELWQKMAVPNAIAERDLAWFSEIWPSIERGDVLACYRSGEVIRFYFRRAVATRSAGASLGPAVPLGQRQDAELADAFIAIWLSTGSPYPQMRRDLLASAQAMPQTVGYIRPVTKQALANSARSNSEASQQ